MLSESNRRTLPETGYGKDKHDPFEMEQSDNGLPGAGRGLRVFGHHAAWNRGDDPGRFVRSAAACGVFDERTVLALPILWKKPAVFEQRPDEVLPVLRGIFGKTSGEKAGLREKRRPVLEEIF